VAPNNNEENAAAWQNPLLATCKSHAHLTLKGTSDYGYSKCEITKDSKGVTKRSD
jgi:hypothetical protein